MKTSICSPLLYTLKENSKEANGVQDAKRRQRNIREYNRRPSQGLILFLDVISIAAQRPGTTGAASCLPKAPKSCQLISQGVPQPPHLISAQLLHRFPLNGERR